MTGFGVVVGYMLLGSTWVVMKSDGNTREWARRTAKYVLGLVAIFVGVVSLSMPLMDEEIAKFWFSKPNIYYLAPIPLLTAACFAMIWRDLHKEKRDYRPFMFSIFIFLFGYAGIIISLYPYMIPFEVTYWDAAAYSASLSILLVGAVILLPTILAYTAYSYYVFRGKTSHESYY
jgi:cytochrome d ubiquinol oxidase subunit II